MRSKAAALPVDGLSRKTNCKAPAGNVLVRPAVASLVLTGGTPTVTVSNVILLARRAGKTLSITELQPFDGELIGKSIKADGSVSEYPLVKWWRQSVAVIPATIPGLFAYLREARKRNICLIRGAPANVERKRTQRQKAGIYGSKDRGDHGFLDEPTNLLFLDVDGFPVKWRDDPEGAVKTVVAQLGEPWSSTSFVWFFSATHGLELVKDKDKPKRWTGGLTDGKVRVRLAFITDRALIEREAVAFTNIAKVNVPALDRVVCYTTQPNYIRRMLWAEHPDRDPLGDIPTIGRITGARERLTLPDDLAHQARWAHAQGGGSRIENHPDAISAVLAIGSDGHVRGHLMAAVGHLLIDNPAPEVVSHADHSIAIVNHLRSMVDQHREHIIANLAQHKRGWGDVLHYLPDNMIDWANWSQEHRGALNRKTIRLIKEEKKAIVEEAPTLEEICERVARAIDRARKGEMPVKIDPFEALIREQRGAATVELIAAPTGSRKSTLMRAAAVLYVAEHPDKTVVILIPRHDLGNEQIKRLMEEHPNYDGGAAIWRGRHADDPDAPDPDHPGKFLKMCQRSEEAQEIEKAKLDVERSLCKRGRGKRAVKCPLYDTCAYQGQKGVRAGIWFAAHEVMVHRKPKGEIGWVLVDESPTDAFIFGVEKPIELPLDKLRDPTPPILDERDTFFLRDERYELYRVLDRLKVPIDPHKGVPVTTLDLGLMMRSARRSAVLELKGKVDPKISPAMTQQQVKQALESAAGNDAVFTRKLLWDLVAAADRTDAERYGRIQMYRNKNGRVIRMSGLEKLAKGWNVQTLICDATGDPVLLKAIWPWLQTEAEPWPQLPRPESVKVYQIVDRSLSKYSIAVESKIKEDTPKHKEEREKDLERKGESARKLYAALLLKAMSYGGADVAAIVYKSTRKWIKDNCFVPAWLKLAHHGNVTGTNIFENVRALFEIGRMQPPPEAMVRQAEAMFGEFIPQREYVKGNGQIPIVTDEAGNTAIEVIRQYRHRHPMVHRLLRQAREGGSIQNDGRARAGLRTEASPLDIHRWTDLPEPELGPAVPVLWEEVEAGLDGIMLATGGIWLESIPDAAEAYNGLFTVNSLVKAKTRYGDRTLLIIDSYLAESYHRNGLLIQIQYQRPGAGRRLVRAVSLRDPAATRAWLEEKLGPLAIYEVLEPEKPDKRVIPFKPRTAAERMRAYRARRAASSRRPAT
jgi:hypothetical protein